MSYEVIVDNVSRAEWERSAVDFADYSMYQTWPYQENRALMARQQISRVLIRDEQGNIRTMCHIRVKRINSIGLKIGYVQWGPLVRAKDGTFKCDIQALKALRGAYVGTKVDVLRLVPNVCSTETGKNFSEMLISSGFQCVRSIAPYRTLMVRIRDTEEEILQNSSRSFRQTVRRAERAGIEIRQGHNDELCEITKKIYLDAKKRKGFKGVDPDDFIEPQRALSPTEKINIIVAYWRSEPVSVQLISNLGETAIGLLTASNERGLECGASYYVCWKGAVSALQAGMRWYDLGGIDPKNEPKVYEFKLREGGEEFYHIGAFEASSSISTRATWRMVEKMYNLIKK